MAVISSKVHLKVQNFVYFRLTGNLHKINLQTVLHSRTASFGQMHRKTMNNMFEKFDITVMTFQKHCTILGSLVKKFCRFSIP
jgi:S-adenosylmethionine synthetase